MNLGMKLKYQHAFTLLELSIVIVIIGLIVAGISAGQSLVRQAQLRSVISEVKNYETTMNSFVLAYDALPGDMNNAQDYWGVGTDNGDGDKAIEWQAEAVDAWQQLSLSGLLNEQYTGVATYDPGGTFPNAAISGAGYHLESGNNTISLASWTPSDLVLTFGAPFVAAIGVPISSIITVPEAALIDTKVDEGAPFTGKTRIRADNAQTCAEGVFASPNNTAQETANAYNLDASGILCNLLFKIR